MHLWLSKIHILLWKEGMPPCNHLKLYISVNLDKKGPKWCNLACKIQNFLRQGGTSPLRPPKLYIGLRINFDRKGSKIVHLWKEGLPLATTRNHNISEIQSKKGLKLCIFGSQNTIFVPGKGHFPLANTARGPAPGPREGLSQTLSLLALLAVEPPHPAHVEILHKHMDSTPPIIHSTHCHYTLAISQYVMSMCVKKYQNDYFSYLSIWLICEHHLTSVIRNDIKW